MIDDELRLAQARLQLDRADADELVRLAFDAVAAGRQSQALFGLVGLPPRAPLADVAPLFARVLGELGLPPIDDARALELILWRPARTIAAAILDGSRAPLDGARALEALNVAFEHPRALADFCYAVSLSDPDVLPGVGLPKLEQVVRDAARTLLQR